VIAWLRVGRSNSLVCSIIDCSFGLLGCLVSALAVFFWLVFGVLEVATFVADFLVFFLLVVFVDFFIT